MIWQELVACALVGTARQPLPAMGGNGPLGELVGGLAGGDPARVLLAAAAATALYEQAGRVPAKLGEPAPTPAEPEERPPCSARAATHLATMLGSSYRQLLPEWLELLVASGRALPPELLPDLLAWGRTEAAHRARLLAAVGRRGLWLAAQNPDWQYVALADDDDATWQTGVRATRLLLLQRLRREDPERARQLLESTWKSESAKNRAEFLETFADGLSIADEPFLEAALDDRSREVRLAAAALLRRLAASRLVARMTGRVQPLLTLMPKPRIHVRLPEVCDAAMQRDGVDPKPQGGERAGWLRQMLAAIPPSSWCRHWERTPAELIEAASHGEWQQLLLLAWAEAAVAHREAEWIALLVAQAGVEPLQESLFEAASPAVREAFLLELLEREGEKFFSDYRRLGLLVRHTPWSPSLSRVLISSLRRHLGTAQAQPSRGWHLRAQLITWAHHLPCELFGEIEQGWPEDSPHWSFWSEPIRDMLACLRFRREMRAALAESSF